MTIQTTKIPRRQKCVDKNHPYIGGADDVIDDKSELTVSELVGNKDYNAALYSGMGRVTLKKNIVNGMNTLTQSMINQANTIYVIQYDFTLGEDITVPANCVLEFDGGSISNGTLVGQNTGINSNETNIFDGVVFDGTWMVHSIYSNWFKNATSEDVIIQAFNLCNSNIVNELYIDEGIYNVSLKTYGVTTLENVGILINKSYINVHLKGTIKIADNDKSSYVVVSIKNANHIKIIGGTILGDRSNHDFNTSAEELGPKVISTSAANTPKNIYLHSDGTVIKGELEPSASIAGNVYWVAYRYGEYKYYKAVNSDSGYQFRPVNSHEWGHGIAVYGCNNVSIENVSISNCIGDGIYVNSSNSTNIKFCNIDLCRRQGISLISGSNFAIENSDVSRIGGTDPSAVIDLEPNSEQETISNVFINNIKAVNCDAGYYLIGRSTHNIKKVAISNCYIKDEDGTHLIAQGANSFNVAYSEDVTVKQCGAYNVGNRILNCQENATAVKFSDLHIDTQQTLNDAAFWVWTEAVFENCLINVGLNKLVRAGSTKITFNNCNISCNRINHYIDGYPIIFDNCNIIHFGNMFSGNLLKLRFYKSNILFTCKSDYAILGGDDTGEFSFYDCKIRVNAINAGKNVMTTTSNSTYIFEDCEIINETENNITGLYIQGSNFIGKNNRFTGKFSEYYKFSWRTTTNHIDNSGLYPVRGATSNRPIYGIGDIVKNLTLNGIEYFDTDLCKPIYFVKNTTYPNGAWVDATGTNVTWPIEYRLTNLSASNYAQPNKDMSYDTKLTANSGYSLPAAITVKFSSTTLTEGTDYTYNSTTGAIKILGIGGSGGVTGYVIIIADGVANS